MSVIQTFPYLRPKQDRFRVKDWQLQKKENLEPLVDVLEDWDPGTPLSIQVGIELDIENIRADCQIPPTDKLRLSLLWHSTGTGLRGKGSQIDLDGKYPSRNEILSLDVEGSLLGDRLRLEILLLLPYPGTSLVALSPKLPGSIIWRTEKIIILEGRASRFPTEVIDFAASSWLPEEAGWFLDWDSSDLQQPALGSFRLLINSRHEKVMQALKGSSPSDMLIQNAIRFDVGRTMIMGALDQDDFVANSDNYKEGSIGVVIRRLLNGLFPNQSIEGLHQARQQNPFRMECQLQDRLKLFQEN
jgi:hypothetical protein